MQVSIMIVDGIATNRVALKVKLTAAWYDVVTVASGADALAKMALKAPSLVLANDTLADMSLTQFAAAARGMSNGEDTPILAMTKDKSARVALLEAGVEDILDMPLDDRLLVARVRSVLRVHAAEAEWRLRDSTCRALGFAEPRPTFEARIPILVMDNEHRVNTPALDALADIASLQVKTCPVEEMMRAPNPKCKASVVLLPLPIAAPETGLNLLADLRAHPSTRHKAFFVLVPAGRGDLAAQALDLGADDVAMMPGLPQDTRRCAQELSLRAHRLHIRQSMSQSLRTIVRSGAEAALRDPLTGLHNRRYALPHLDRITEQSQANARPFAVMVADIDHFKRVNDIYGHAVGDAVLAEVAKRLKDNMRAVDLVARIGGEEFLIVLPGTGRAAARNAARRLCEQISGEPIEIAGLTETIRVTISIGLAVSTAQPDLFDLDPPVSSSEPAVMLKRADRALYSAKASGRNQFMLEHAA